MVRQFLCASVLLLVVSASPAIGVAETQTQTAAQTPVAAPARTRTAVTKPARATAASPVNLNTATAADLQTLPGVGKAMAARILEYRQKNGSFRKTEDLMNVKGIGEKSFLKLKPLVTIAKTTGQG